jgi:hypothetical protein
MDGRSLYTHIACILCNKTTMLITNMVRTVFVSFEIMPVLLKMCYCAVMSLMSIKIIQMLEISVNARNDDRYLIGKNTIRYLIGKNTIIIGVR